MSVLKLELRFGMTSAEHTIPSGTCVFRTAFQHRYNQSKRLRII